MCKNRLVSIILYVQTALELITMIMPILLVNIVLYSPNELYRQISAFILGITCIATSILITVFFNNEDRVDTIINVLREYGIVNIDPPNSFSWYGYCKMNGLPYFNISGVNREYRDIDIPHALYLDNTDITNKVIDIWNLANIDIMETLAEVNIDILNPHKIRVSSSNVVISDTITLNRYVQELHEMLLNTQFVHDNDRDLHLIMRRVL